MEIWKQARGAQNVKLTRQGKVLYNLSFLLHACSHQDDSLLVNNTIFRRKKKTKANEQVRKGKPSHILPCGGREIWRERESPGCKSLASRRSLEHMETKAAFKGCSQQCQTLQGWEEEEEVTRPWCSSFCHFSWPAGSRTGRLEPAHPRTLQPGTAPLGAFLLARRGCWQPRAFKCSSVAVCFCWLFVEPKCWKWILRKLLKVSVGCSPARLWSLLEHLDQGSFASPALDKICAICGEVLSDMVFCEIGHSLSSITWGTAGWEHFSAFQFLLLVSYLSKQ